MSGSRSTLYLLKTGVPMEKITYETTFQGYKMGVCILKQADLFLDADADLTPLNFALTALKMTLLVILTKMKEMETVICNYWRTLL